jgi:hypothetical protein
MIVYLKGVVRPSILIRLGIILLAIPVFSTSCSIVQKQQTVISPDPHRELKTKDCLKVGAQPKTENHLQLEKEFKSVEKRILDQYRHWKGTRHQMGGTSSQGIDCSGFVMTVYRNAFNINLPRTTRAQVQQGKFVSLNDLKPGDLVFFRPPGYPRHVGIYLSRSEFVHASKSKGVTISKIDKHYWGKYFWTAKRIIPESKD